LARRMPAARPAPPEKRQFVGEAFNFCCKLREWRAFNARSTVAGRFHGEGCADVYSSLTASAGTDFAQLAVSTIVSASLPSTTAREQSFANSPV
jgi:hypothetical protein